MYGAVAGSGPWFAPWFVRSLLRTKPVPELRSRRPPLRQLPARNSLEELHCDEGRRLSYQAPGTCIPVVSSRTLVPATTTEPQ